jgi:hypothetical protein
MFGKPVGRWFAEVHGVISWLPLELVSQPLLVPVRLHAFAALMLGNFCFPSFLKRAHSVFQICGLQVKHLIRPLQLSFSPAWKHLASFAIFLIMLFHN